MFRLHNDLTARMPPYYQHSGVVATINDANMSELERMDKLLIATVEQFFVHRADYALERWEREAGLDVSKNIAADFRRSRILSKLRGSGTITVKLIRDISESFSNAESDVIEHATEYRFTIKFVGVKGIPPNLDDLRAAIEDCKPAHLAFDFSYTYNTWGMISALTWGQAAASTWGQLKTR